MRLLDCMPIVRNRVNKVNISQRRRARRLALQALYQWTMSNADLYEIEAQFRADLDPEKIDLEYFKELLYKIPGQITEIEDAFSLYLDRKINELNPIELTTLRMGTYELLFKLDIPYKVAINEAVELNKEFGTVDGYRYVNGILDKVAQVARAAELR